MGIEVEGPRQDAFAVLARCHEVLATAPGVRRTATAIKIDDRVGAAGGEIERKVTAVERLT